MKTKFALIVSVVTTVLISTYGDTAAQLPLEIDDSNLTVDLRPELKPIVALESDLLCEYIGRAEIEVVAGIHEADFDNYTCSCEAIFTGCRYNRRLIPDAPCEFGYRAIGVADGTTCPKYGPFIFPKESLMKFVAYWEPYSGDIKQDSSKCLGACKNFYNISELSRIHGETSCAPTTPVLLKGPTICEQVSDREMFKELQDLMRNGAFNP